MQNLGFTSTPVLRKYLRHAERLGLDTKHVLEELDLSEQELGDNSRRLPSELHEQLLTQLAALSGDPLFGLHSAREVEPGSWNVLGYISMNCATLGEAIDRIAPYEKLVGDMGTSRLEMTGELACLIWDCQHQAPEARRHMVENVLASWMLYARWITGTEQSPECVHLEHTLPAGAQAQDYEQLFGCPVRFEQHCNALLLTPSTLALPLRQPDALLLKTLEEHAQSAMAQLAPRDDLPQRVKTLLRQQLKEGLPRKDRLAEQLQLTPRTLDRRLREFGSSYQAVLDQLRLELSNFYLRESDLSLDEIGSRLGFSETRSFHRSFKRWCGMTPGAFRDSRPIDHPETAD